MAATRVSGRHTFEGGKCKLPGTEISLRSSRGKVFGHLLIFFDTPRDPETGDPLEIVLHHLTAFVRLCDLERL